MKSRLDILSNFTEVPPIFEEIISAFTLRLYSEMLAHTLQVSTESTFNSVTFLQACSLILKLLK